MSSSAPTDDYAALVLALSQRDEALFFNLLEASKFDPLERFAWSEPEDTEQDSLEETHPLTECDTLLFHAAKHGCGLAATHLLKLGEDPNHIGNSRMTALSAFLMSAPASETEARTWIPTLVTLLAHGADMDRSWVVGTDGPYTARNIARRLNERGGASWPLFVLEQWWTQEGKARHLSNRLPPAAASSTPRL